MRKRHNSIFTSESEGRRNLKVNRFFTKKLENSVQSVYDLFEWKKVDVRLVNHNDGSVIYEGHDLEFPKEYSQDACNIIASKYFRKTGLGDDRSKSETSMYQVAKRMADFWSLSLYNEGLLDDKSSKIFSDEVKYMILAQIAVPNSPQWFNTGLSLSYGINGPSQGHWYYDPDAKKCLKSRDSYTRTQGSACFILGLEDSLIGPRSLTDLATKETLVFKFGSGAGSNWSAIRSTGEPLSGGGKSSGLMSFLSVSDRNAGAIKSGGTTRRAAKMNILEIDHPEIYDFINWKLKEEDKIDALVKMGYSSGMDGEAVATASGQNSNNSVRVSDDFMRKVSKGHGTITLKGRVSDDINREVEVSDLWNNIVKAAWRCGDPGIQFDDTFNKWHTCPAGLDGQVGSRHNRINATNPCSEYAFLDDTACNLASINVVKFLVNDNIFNYRSFAHTVHLCQLILEATIHWGQFPTEEIAEKSYKFRTTGLGLSNVGALIMSLGIPYDSEEARTLVSVITGLMTGESYWISGAMASKVGPFEAWDVNSEYMKEVIDRHHDSVRSLAVKSKKSMPKSLLNSSQLVDRLESTWDEVQDYKNQGFRNAQVTLYAPTGTISFAMDCSSTSIEPYFSLVTYKKMINGDYTVIVSPVIPQALRVLGYNDTQITDIVDYIMRKDSNGNLIDGKIEGAPWLDPSHYKVFETANRCGTGSQFIDPLGHVKMVAAVTPLISGSVSKTVNLPAEATVEDVSDIFIKSWELGVKSITIYRDGCKTSQPLSSIKEGVSEKSLENLSYADLLEYARRSNHDSCMSREKPSGIRNAKVHEIQIEGHKFYVTVSRYENGKIAEVYVSGGQQGSMVKGLVDSISRMISRLIQYGIDPQVIANMLVGEKFEPSGFTSGHPNIKRVTSICDMIGKVIEIESGNYSHCQVKPDDYQSSDVSSNNSSLEVLADTGEVCSICGSSRMISNGTCKVCAECGTTTSCS